MVCGGKGVRDVVLILYTVRIPCPRTNVIGVLRGSSKESVIGLRSYGIRNKGGIEQRMGFVRECAAAKNKARPVVCVRSVVNERPRSGVARRINRRAAMGVGRIGTSCDGRGYRRSTAG